MQSLPEGPQLPRPDTSWCGPLFPSCWVRLGEIALGAEPSPKARRPSLRPLNSKPRAIFVLIVKPPSSLPPRPPCSSTSSTQPATHEASLPASPFRLPRLPHLPHLFHLPMNSATHMVQPLSTTFTTLPHWRPAEANSPCSSTDVLCRDAVLPTLVHGTRKGSSSQKFITLDSCARRLLADLTDLLSDPTLLSSVDASSYAYLIPPLHSSAFVWTSSSQTSSTRGRQPHRRI